ncbi:acetyl-CoA C-acetyltransferase [Paenibacillus endophyticus]|uniref:acetyl-CoA C-acetyltransferase n=1 Tax=Paenibacillus endophyticus TaxID=1294268 RepID=A0A7W5C5F7_9BACL|nr:acetyl-CoA C-acetyltransferase [Paenibacillus endophyticus]MBB3151505.1 acetyl-CoA C-acetyltransferase [Paenibacillus endophyticus]
MAHAVIVGGKRTPFGKLGGTFKNVDGVQLGASAIRGSMQQCKLASAEIDGIIMGMVLQAGNGQNPARQAAIRAGLDWSIQADTINKVCASGMRAITLAEQLIRAGDAEVMIAGGMESMSQTPFAARIARWGNKLGHAELTDLMIHDGLLCPFHDVLMAVHGNQAAAEYGISRTEQDEWALRSHARACSAMDAGLLAEEIEAFATLGSVMIDQDECPRRDTSARKLAMLQSIAGAYGTITAGNAPGVNDGAASLVLMSAEAAARKGCKPLARIAAHASIGTRAPHLAAAPALAIQKLLHKQSLSLKDIDLFEVNEAFAAVPLICGDILGWDDGKVNVAGGAIALGHPIGASGARIVLTLMHQLRRRGGGLGIAAICSGGAQGDAILIEVR